MSNQGNPVSSFNPSSYSAADLEGMRRYLAEQDENFKELKESFNLNCFPHCHVFTDKPQEEYIKMHQGTMLRYIRML